MWRSENFRLLTPVSSLLKIVAMLRNYFSFVQIASGRLKSGGAPAAAVVKRPFYLVNQHSRFVLEIHGGLTVAGTHLEIWRPRPDKARHQLWYQDPGTGLIRSMVNDWVLECKGIGNKITIGPHTNAPGQMWCHEGLKIVNRMWPTECLEVRAGDCRDGGDVILARYENRPWQHWVIEYV